ncbi:MAG TPA: DUF3261 domain-containing protein [Thermoanaerobaculia bacterium]|nr:DUF3261 domain-containing protein [Thermoanaerobaculia bacterium]
MKRAAVALLAVVVLAAGCRTGRPGGAPIAPLTASTSEEAMQQLRARRAEFGGVKSLMRVRATTNGKTQSFRAQLAVHDAQRMDLIAYTPVGTTALKLHADGARVTTEPEVPPGSFDFLRVTGLAPAEVGMLLVGLPPRDDLQVQFAPMGLASASAGEITVTFDPPSYPAKRVVVTRGADRIEIEHLEVASE